MKTKKSLLALLLLAATSMFFGCGHHDPYTFDGINWNGSNSGTLELINGSNKDIILFVGQVPSQSSMLGGVRAGATIKHDISKHVSDFAVGGYAVLRGVTKEEYNKSHDPANAKIEFTAMVTYRGGAIYRYNIDLNYMGDNGFRVTNKGRIGMELRKNSPDGEKVAYLPALQVNQMVYTQTTEAITLFPVYVFFQKSTGEVSTLRSSSMFDGVMAAPRPLGPKQSIQDIYFPNDETLTWEYIVGTLKQSSAYITVVNNIVNQAGYVTNALSRRLISQSGFDAIGSGERLVYEVESTDEGAGIGLIVNFYNGNIPIPVLKEGETTSPIIKNGYNYTVTVDYLGGGITDKANYKATIVEGSKRDVSKDIESL
ncbi:MAG: hypothetical protein LBC75_11420 [Fibromonadaceae bacterium]|nr:hypothetical protein [Fibromonadaceae bacterium]